MALQDTEESSEEESDEEEEEAAQVGLAVSDCNCYAAQVVHCNM